MKSRPQNLNRSISGVLVAAVIAITLSGCASSPSWLPSSGPNYAQVQEAPNTQPSAGIQIVDVNDAVARKLLASQKQSLFSETLSTSTQSAYVIGAGDVIEVSVWEAPPAALFGSGAIDSRTGP